MGTVELKTQIVNKNLWENILFNKLFFSEITK